MTKEQAIEILNNKGFTFCNFERCVDFYTALNCEKCEEALKMAIEALRQESNEDCISRRYVLNKIHDYAEADTTSTGCSVGADYCAEFVEDAPSAVPSRPIGKWYIREYEFFTCDQCGEDVPNGAEYTQEAQEMLKNENFPNYCPNCGAKMEEGE